MIKEGTVEALFKVSLAVCEFEQKLRHIKWRIFDSRIIGLGLVKLMLHGGKR
jgi:hypothetical protein